MYTVMSCMYMYTRANNKATGKTKTLHACYCNNNYVFMFTTVHCMINKQSKQKQQQTNNKQTCLVVHSDSL